MDAMRFVKSSALETKVMVLLRNVKVMVLVMVKVMVLVMRFVKSSALETKVMLLVKVLVLALVKVLVFALEMMVLVKVMIRGCLEKQEEEEESPLSSIVARDRVQICEEGVGDEDKERLLFEFERIVAPQVSAFQLGEIVVPTTDRRQLGMFLKRKLGEDVNLEEDVAWSACVEVGGAVVYVAARLQGECVHLVLVGRKVGRFLGSSEFRERFNPPRTRRDKQEWQTWTQTHLRALRESAVRSAEELLNRRPVHAQMW